uniref:Ankyrin repeat and LEM domain-containing protein 2 n=1 Tax=Lepisosteus oculatus TaxID=7918 RepID=W5M3Y0_LEPOC|nr:PREDICTED: ankyrin repeat and LEM domain-containing protein 2 [Lepisosteus oculatus]XP_015221419.1 PREDICTED: ankyrin repeat and LEM domain-containing protein 2 [Lepisosteus oculatus]XP_015221420.1 PREDICTED: ankyrin repeat and LEM domain-containing protein 2 [Lepisosteus oculatus]XP_015221421.1 PREDICTED: ankyrin repeat and LEM domain-containing protein 2 [Lepisosteus oculatus]
MEAILSRLKELSDDKLRERIISTGLKCGPITATTRALFEKKLARTLLESKGGGGESSGASDAAWGSSGGTGGHSAPGDTPTDSATDKRRAAGEEGDFGYGVGLNPPEEEALSDNTGFRQSSSVDGDRLQTPSKAPQASPPLYYGVCPVWEDVTVRNDRVNVYADKKEALQAVKMMKGARFKAFANREDAEKFAKGICDYLPSPSKSLLCVSPGKPGMVFSKDVASSLEVETINRERANSYKSPRTQDLTAKLRKAVEKGDEATFTELVWSNPRYLIGSGDNPTVVQEGCRYNVMHVAAKENQPSIAQLLLDTLENPEFMRLMYPDDQEAMLQKRICYIVDLYLNTPDKAGFETPLHFACKFGCPEVVNVLCSHPYTDKNCKNKFDQKPVDLICERKNKTQEVKQKIKDYLEDRCYIPLLRATDNSSQPVIGAPWSPEPSDTVHHSFVSDLTQSPRDPVMAVRAFAGPLSPSKAEEFRKVWKTPPRERAGHFHHILKSDPDRGAERVGRDLAREMGHPWAEHWEFLGCFVDLSSAEGLRKLEEHLSKKDLSDRVQEAAGENETSNRFKTPSPGKPKKFCNSISVGAFLDEDDDISLEEMKNRQNAALTSISAVSAMDGLKGAVGGLECRILPMKLGADLIETAAEEDRQRQGKGLAAAGKNGFCSSVSGDQAQNGERPPPGTSGGLLSPVSNLLVEFERMSLRDGGENEPRRPERGRGAGPPRPREGGDSGAPPEPGPGPSRPPSSAREEPAFGKGGVETRDGGFWKAWEGSEADGEADDKSSSSSDEWVTADESLEPPSQGTLSAGASARGRCARSKSWDHGGRDLNSSGSSSSSYKSIENSQEDFIFSIPSNVKKGPFVEGESPTKLDRDVLLAIGDIEIDPQKYPSIHKWKNTINTHSSSEMQSWPSPVTSRGRPRIQTYTPASPSCTLLSTPGRFSPARPGIAPDITSPGRYSPAHASCIQRLRLWHINEPPV